MLAIDSPLPQFFGLDGSPLDAGFVYVGTASGNPETSPVTVYWDAAGTQPAAQPLRTLNGYVSRDGTPAKVYFSGDYSLSTRDRMGRRVFYSSSSGNSGNALALQTQIDDLVSGATSPAWLQSGTGAVSRTVADKLRDTVSAFDFMTAAQIADVRAGTALLDVTAAFQAAITYAIASDKDVEAEAGQYKLTAPLAITGGVSIVGKGQGVARLLCFNCDAFAVSAGVSLFSVKSLTIANASRYTTTPNTNTAISINGTTASQCYWHSFEDVFIDGFQVGIYAGGLCSSSFRNVTTVYTYQSVNFSQQCLNNAISDSRFGEQLASTVGGYGIKVGDGTVNCEGLFISNTLIYGTYTGLWVFGAINVVARGNILDMIRQVGILSQSTASAGSINHTFTENYIGVIGAAGEEGIYLANAYAPADAQNRGNVVRDNEILAYAGATLNYGILVDGAEEERNTISGNRVQNTVVFDARIVTGSGHRLSDNLWRSTNGFSTTVPVKYASTNVGAVSAPIMVYSASMTPDMSLNHSFDVTATNGTAFTINAPTNDSLRNTVDWDLRITIRNGSGGALGAATWNATYKMAAWTNPANGFSRSITFRWNGTNYVEVARTPADIPN